MKVKCFTAWQNTDGKLLTEEDIDEGSAHLVEVSRDEFERRVFELATDAAQDCLMVKVGGNSRILALVFSSMVYCYEFESELAAELILQLFNTSRRAWRKQQGAPF